MSVDKSLKTNSATSKHNNVLRRSERILKLKEEGRWPEDGSPFGLVKVANRKIKVGGKTKKKATTEETAEAEAAEPKKE